MEKDRYEKILEKIRELHNKYDCDNCPFNNYCYKNNKAFIDRVCVWLDLDYALNREIRRVRAEEYFNSLF